jgi:3-dehydroquinate synthase
VRTVKVPLGKRSYLIKIGEGLLAQLGPECGQLGLGRRCAVITDSQVGRRYAAAALKSLKAAGFDPLVVTFPAGEAQKNLRNVQACYDQLAKHRLERKSFVVALGGGVVGDLAGFVASTYLRGIPFVQVPTTLLAQVDSSVGGKVGVNLKAGKNLVGAFHQPRLVLCDLATLDSLPRREYRAGLAEVIKYGIIWDAHLFRGLEMQMHRLLRRDPALLALVVARSCEIKASVVGQDETESGLRAILNFGHTIGHAIEAVSRYGRFLHGEAISIGQVAAARLSEELMGLSTQHVTRIRSLFHAAGLPVRLNASPALQRRLLDAMRLDKKVSGGVIQFVLARKIGSVEHGCQVPAAALKRALSELNR